jgi:hypothetical protein
MDESQLQGPVFHSGWVDVGTISDTEDYLLSALYQIPVEKQK